jgi:saccharopine dehydrogenase (NAD+, L-lysine-forming)
MQRFFSSYIHPLRSFAMSSTSSTSKPSLWLRCETKPHEHRSALTPTTAKALLDAGFDITVERDPQRIFEDSEFEA